MKRIIVSLILVSISFCLFADKVVDIVLSDGASFKGQLLFGSDSLLYIWSGLGEFNQTQLQYVNAFKYDQIDFIKLRSALTWGQGIKRVFPFSLGTGIIITASSDGTSSFGEKILQTSVYTLVFSIPAGALISIGSHFFTNSVSKPTSNDFNFTDGKHKKYLILKTFDTDVISTIITEVKP